MIAPDQVAVDFLKDFKKLCEDYLDKDSSRRIILITGGGAPARNYQKAYTLVVENPKDDAQDWIGIMATRLNGELVRQVLAENCLDPVVTDPGGDFEFSGRILVAAGWKPGFSTDYDAVLLAQRFGAKTLINLSNISKVYTADPKSDPKAKALDSVSWSEFVKIVGTQWTPGKNLPFDPIATQGAKELDMSVYFASGKDLENVGRLLEGKDFEGTTIHP